MLQSVVNPFYSYKNMEYLVRALDQFKTCGGTRHELIENQDDCYPKWLHLIKML